MVIPCHNAAAVIEHTVASILQQSVRPIEIICVENHSTDGTWEVLGRLAVAHPEVDAIVGESRDRRHRPVSVAANAGIARARYPVVVRVDDDTELLPGSLEAIVAPLSEPRVAAVAANVRVGNAGASFWTRCQAIEYAQSMELDRRAQRLYHAVLCCSGAFAAFRTDDVWTAGGYHLDRRVSEDMEMTLRMHRRGKVAMAPAAVAFTEVPTTLLGLARQRWRWTYAGVIALWIHRRGVGNPRYGHRGGAGLIGLPLRVFFGLLSLAPTPIKVLLAGQIARQGLGSFALAFSALSGLHALVIGVGMALIWPVAASRRGYGYIWLLLPYTLLYEPLVGLVNAAGTLTGLGYVLVRHP